MNPRATAVTVTDDYRLVVRFANGETRFFDVRPYLDLPVFRPLRDPKAFAAARVRSGTVVWDTGQDICPDTLYEDSLPAPRARRRAAAARTGRRSRRPRAGAA